MDPNRPGRSPGFALGGHNKWSDEAEAERQASEEAAQDASQPDEAEHHGKEQE